MILIWPAVHLARVRKASSAAPISATTSSLTHGSWLGIEATVDGTSLRKTVAVPLADFVGDTFGSMTASSNASVQGSVRGRLGIAFDRLLLYGTGGVAITSFNTTYFDTTGFFTGVPGTNTTISNTRAGFTSGGGIEYADHRQLVGAGGIPLFEFRHMSGLSVRQSERNFVQSRIPAPRAAIL